MMPISDDELDPRVYSSLPQNGGDYRYAGLSKAEQRKNNKPIMEKRRRARINQCLNELKALILDATNKDPARHTKLEKADILEMTVKHLQSIQRQHLSAAVAADPTVVHKFRNGFNECAAEVSRYIGSLDGVDFDVKKRLMSHLINYITGPTLQQQQYSQLLSLTAFTNAVNGAAGNVDDVNQHHRHFGNNFNNNTNNTNNTNNEDNDDDDNSNSNNNRSNNNNNNNDNLPSRSHLNDVSAAAARFQGVSGLQLIPSRLPSGELALLLPNPSSLSSLFPGSALDACASRVVDRAPRVSAFTPVAKDAAATAAAAKALFAAEDAAVATAAPSSSVVYESSHSEVSSTSNDGLSFKTPCTPTKSQLSPAVMSSSSSSSLSSLLIPITELQSSSSSSLLTQYKKKESFALPSDRHVFKPLTVYTDPCYERNPLRCSTTSPPPPPPPPPLVESLESLESSSSSSSSSSATSTSSHKSPLDFSIKKEADEMPSSTQRVAKKRPLEDLPCNVPLPTKSMRLSKADSAATAKVECDSGKDLSSGGSDSTVGVADMWRPW